MKKTLTMIVLLTLSLTAPAQTERPTMGWSSWNTYRVNISDSLIMRQADAMVSKGLKKAGYQYVNIDDGYFGGRDKTTGRLLIHPKRFPNGLKPVVDHIHSIGLKAGIYSDAGRNTCGSIYDADTVGVGVGLYGHDRQDCDMFFRELGFDFIKVDYCGGRPHPKGDTLALDEKTRYTEIAEAIRQAAEEKDVRLNVCRWDYPGTWVSDVASSWRMSHDIRPRWESVKDIILQNLYLSAYAGDGHYNDMDMLEVGRGMSEEEDHTHFAVWCMMSSPLLIGCDLTKIKPQTLALLTDPQLISINQDPLGLQAYVAKRQGDCYVLVKDIKELNGRERAVAFVNLSDKETTMTLDLQEIDLVGDALSASLPPHATRVFIVKGKQRLQRKRYEAETAFLSSYQEIKNHQAYLTAIYEEDSRCSGGVKASWLGGRADNDLRWRDVYVQKAGKYALRLQCLTPELRTLYVDVNGKTIDSLTYTADGEQTVFATLKKGRNEVRLWNDRGRMPDVDCMTIGDSPVGLGKLTIEGRTEPLGLDECQPRFGWQLLAGENDGRLRVSDNQRFLQYESGKPFFWLGETAWLMPERLKREEVEYYLQTCHEAEYNMVQVQVLNGVPSFNAYGVPSHDKQGHLLTDAPYSYWDHMDYIIDVAARNDIYIGMVCIWGSLVKGGKLSVEQAKTYGTFLANRYKNRPNIVWIMGGDIQGNIHPEVWETLATTIKQIDKNHLMTYHPRGRYTSAHWWSQASWIDFHTFQSGHRRYGQRMGNKDYPIPDNTEEDNWMYVDSTWAYKPLKPVLDDEPIYEGIPQGLHDANEPLWQACDVRRYAYWSVFAGSCGHTYGNNAIMQFYREGYPPAYHCRKTWTEALHDPGFNQMKYLKRLMLALPYFERVPDQSIVLDEGKACGTQYDRLAATRGTDYLLVYNYTSRAMKIDLRKISGTRKKVWWMDASTGRLTWLGEYDSKVLTFRPHRAGTDIEDGVLIAIDAAKDYMDTLITFIDT